MLTIKKIIIVWSSILLIFTSANAQNKKHSVYGQVLGPSVGYGIGYDTRFKTGSPFGYSIGIAFTNVSSHVKYSNELIHNLNAYSLIDCNNHINSKGLTLPLELNAILGSKNSKFDIGIGITPFIGCQWYSITGYDSDDNYDLKKYNGKHEFKIKGICSASIGYRLQRSNGFFMRLGMTVCIGGSNNISFIRRCYLLPNICLGYTIKSIAK